MTNELSKKQLVICLRNGIFVWIDEDVGKELMKDRVEGKIKGDIMIAGRCLNSVDISGIVLPSDIEDLTRRKNGEWKCETAGVWHERGQRCDCVDRQTDERNKAIYLAIANCGKCKDGYIFENEVARQCECIKEFIK